LGVILGTKRELPRNDRPVQNSGSSKNFLFLRGLTSKNNFLIPEKSYFRTVLKKSWSMHYKIYRKISFC